MRRDKKAAQKKKSRMVAKRSAAQAAGPAAALRQAKNAEFGPAYMSVEWRSDELPPRLVSVVITRKLAGGRFAAQAMLVDRTCLGVKNAFVLAPITRYELDDFVDQLGSRHEDPLEEVEVTMAQAVVSHAIDYAERLGFEPHQDFERPLIEPVPQILLLTPLAEPAQPFFVPGPDDDVDAILATLEEAVGEDYEFGGDFQFEEGLDDDEEDERAPDEEALFEAQRTWAEAARTRDDLDLATGMQQFVQAMNGGASKELHERDVTSLPFFWATMFRPLGNEIGLDLALRAPEMAAHGDELERLKRSRATIFEVLGLDLSRGLALCRDLLDGSQLNVRFLPHMLARVTRWTRFFGYVTPMADDTWYPPSLLVGHVAMRKTPIADLLAHVNALLAELGIEERVDPASPLEGLTRFGGLAHGVIKRVITPVEIETEESKAPIFFVNSDDERYEAHDATIQPGAAASKRLLAALASADDFVADKDRFLWMREPTGVRVSTDEPIAIVVAQPQDTFRLDTNSVSRFERLVTRLSALAETKLEPTGVVHMRPWEQLPNTVGEDVPGCKKLVLSGLRRETAPPTTEELRAKLGEHLERTIHEHVPILGGRPIDLAKDPASQASVEAWLQEQELKGLEDELDLFVDLDDIRAKLGLPPTLVD